MTIRIAQEDAPDEATRDTISTGLDTYSIGYLGVTASVPLWIVARDEAQVVVGGLRGAVMWTWFYLDTLWVDEPARGAGLGSALLSAGEAAAVAQGCTDAFLNTFSFQAPAFYRRHGYEPFGELPGFPGGHSLFYLRKPLGPPALPPHAPPC